MIISATQPDRGIGARQDHVRLFIVAIAIVTVVSAVLQFSAGLPH